MATFAFEFQKSTYYTHPDYPNQFLLPFMCVCVDTTGKTCAVLNATAFLDATNSSTWADAGRQAMINAGAAYGSPFDALTLDTCYTGLMNGKRGAVTVGYNKSAWGTGTLVFNDGVLVSST